MPPTEPMTSQRDLTTRLDELYGPALRDPLPLGNKADPVDELVYILLTLMTRSQPRIDRAYDRLRKLARGRWPQLLERDRSEITAVLRPLGFVERRTDQLLGMLEDPLISSVDASQQLAALDDEELLATLTSLPGIGVKSAKCVMMYSLDRQVLPVDVHVARVARRLGYLPDGLTLLQADRELDPQVPPELRFDVHVQFVRHGRAVCQQPTPRCTACPLADCCPSSLA